MVIKKGGGIRPCETLATLCVSKKVLNSTFALQMFKRDNGKTYSSFPDNTTNNYQECQIYIKKYKKEF